MFPSPFVGGYPGRIREEFIVKKNSKKATDEAWSEVFQLFYHFRFNHTALTLFAPNDTR